MSNPSLSVIPQSAKVQIGKYLLGKFEKQCHENTTSEIASIVKNSLDIISSITVSMILLTVIVILAA